MIGSCGLFTAVEGLKKGGSFQRRRTCAEEAGANCDHLAGGGRGQELNRPQRDCLGAQHSCERMDFAFSWMGLVVSSEPCCTRPASAKRIIFIL